MVAAFILFPLLTQAQVTATITSTNVTCFGLCNGSATVTASGGVGALIPFYGAMALLRRRLPVSAPATTQSR